MEPEIARSALRHGIAEEDILHACRNAFLRFEKDDGVMYIGADRSGRIMEVMVVNKTTTH